MGKGRTSNAIARARVRATVAGLHEGKHPKAIASEIGVNQSRVVRIARGAGMLPVYLAPDERAMIDAHRTTGGAAL